MLLGVQVSTEGKIYEAFTRAGALGCNTMQIFARNPQRRREHFLESPDVEEFSKRKSSFGIKPVFIHIPYVTNLATPKKRLYELSVGAYVEDVLEADILGAEYIVTHMGSHKDSDEKQGLARLTQALNTILEKTPSAKVGLLLENTSGSGSWLGYTFAHQKSVIEGLKDSSRVGLCLDTAHAFSAGYDIASKKGLDSLLDEIDGLIGLEQLKLIHLNDSKDKLGSRRDRHEHIGKGKIGMAAMRRIVNHPKLKDKPFILETPKDNEASDNMNLTTVRKLRKAESVSF